MCEKINIGILHFRDRVFMNNLSINIEVLYLAVAMLTELLLLIILG